MKKEIHTHIHNTQLLLFCGVRVCVCIYHCKGGFPCTHLQDNITITFVFGFACFVNFGFTSSDDITIFLLFLLDLHVAVFCNREEYVCICVCE